MINLLIKHYDFDIHQKMIPEYLQATGWEFLDSGSYRCVYARVENKHRMRAVIKVPHNDQGFDDNIAEAYCYRKYRDTQSPDEIYFAPCRLLSSGCLMMPYIEHISGEAPKWTRRLDGEQVGQYKGRVVAYDSAYDIHYTEKRDALHWAKVI